MNLILFTPDETAEPLARSDPRAKHLLDILRRQKGDSFDAGIINGPRLKGTIRRIESAWLGLDFQEVGPPPPLHPVSLLVGLPRPQTARKILQEITSLGVGEIHFVRTEKGEPSYAESKLWTTGEYRRHLVAGAEQAFTTRVPLLKHHATLADALSELIPRYETVALDNYEATAALRDYRPSRPPCLLAVGAERGWSANERNLFRTRRIPLLQLGSNVLRTETACLCGLALILARLRCL